MPRKSPLGRLLIVFGPKAKDENSLHQYVGRFRTAPHQTTSSFWDFHAGAWNDNPSPFWSKFFGPAVESLLKGNIVILIDGAFDDQRRRSKVELAFQRTFPDLAIDHVQVGGDAEPGRPGERIVFDGDVFEDGDDGSNEHIVVESDADRYVLRRVLYAATIRMMRVGEDGREYPDHKVTYTREGMANTDAGEQGIYTANYVSGITEDEHGNLGFFIDCKAAIEPPMGAKFRQVLLEEFRKQGISSAHVRVPTE